MADSYLPSAEAELRNWLLAFKTKHTAAGAGFGFTPAEVTALTTAITNWLTTYNNYITAADAARAARETKDTDKDTLLKSVRGAVARLQAAPTMTDAARRDYGITVRDKEPTAATMTAAEATRPVLQISIAQAQRHVISFADEGTPTRKAKPQGIHHIDIFFKKGGPPPASDAEWTYLASDTATPYMMEFDQADAGTTIYYRGCWVTTRAEKGPWSAMVQAKVPG